MIITVTPNPSLDLTYALPVTFSDVDVHRATSSTLEASGKGVNISRALAKAGVPTCAVLPTSGATGRYLEELLTDERVPHRVSPQSGQTRVNTTVLGPDGETAKINGPGATLSPAEQELLMHETVLALQAGSESAATWLAVCGSLPPGADSQLVVALIELAHQHGVRCAVDSSGDALKAALRAGADLVAPNRIELGEVTASGGSYDSIDDLANSAQSLSLETRAELLISLGRDGALFTDGVRVLHGWGPPLRPVNTAGAGDALLAGWLSTAADARTRLVRAISWGRSACLASTTVDPDPGLGDTAHITVADLTTSFDTLPTRVDET